MSGFGKNMKRAISRYKGRTAADGGDMVARPMRPSEALQSPMGGKRIPSILGGEERRRKFGRERNTIMQDRLGG